MVGESTGWSANYAGICVIEIIMEVSAKSGGKSKQNNSVGRSIDFSGVLLPACRASFANLKAEPFQCARNASLSLDFWLPPPLFFHTNVLLFFFLQVEMEDFVLLAQFNSFSPGIQQLCLRSLFFPLTFTETALLTSLDKRPHFFSHPQLF